MKSTKSQPTISTLPLHHYTLPKNFPQFSRLTLYDGLYHGELKNSLKHGMGIFLWNNGDSYYGEWHNNQIHGRGLFCFNTGIYIEGSFNLGQLHGASSIYYPDDSFLKGTFSQGKLVGRILAYDAIREAWYLQDYKSGGGINTLYEGKGKPLAYDYLRDIQGDALKDIGLLSKVDKEFQCIKKDMMHTAPSSCIGCFETGPGVRHYGFLKDGKIAELGIRISSKDIEMGNYQEGELSGFGQRIEFGKMLYKGYFIDGAFNGEGVLYEWTTKTKYEGSFLLGDLVKTKSETPFQPKDFEAQNPLQVPVNPVDTETITNLGLRDLERAFNVSDEPELVLDSPDYRPTIKDILSTAKKICRENVIPTDEIPTEESERYSKERPKHPSINVKDLTLAMQKSPDNIDKALDFSKLCINHLTQKLENYQSGSQPTKSSEDKAEERPFARAFSIEINSSRSQLPQRAKSRDNLHSGTTLHVNNNSNGNNEAFDLKKEKEVRGSRELRRSKDKENNGNGVRLSTVELDLSEQESYAPVRANTEMLPSGTSHSTNEQYIASLLKEVNPNTQKNRSPTNKDLLKPSLSLKKSNSQITVNKTQKSPNAQFSHLSPIPSTTNPTKKNHGLSLVNKSIKTTQSTTLAPGSFMQSCDVPPTRKLRTSIPSFSSSTASSKPKEPLSVNKSQVNVGPQRVQVKALKECLGLSGADRVKTEPFSTQEDTEMLYKQITCESPQESPLEYVKPYVKAKNPAIINELVSKADLTAQFNSNFTFDSGKVPTLGEDFDHRQMVKTNQVSNRSYLKLDSMNLSIPMLGKGKDGVEGKDNTLENIDNMESVVIDPDENSGDFQGSLNKLGNQEIERIMESKLKAMERERERESPMYFHRGSKEDIKKRVSTEGSKDSRGPMQGKRSVSQVRKRSAVEKSPVMKSLSQLSYTKSIYTVEQPEKKPPTGPGKLLPSKSSKSIERGGQQERKGSMIDSNEKPKHLKGTRSMNSLHRNKSSFGIESSSSLHNIRLDGFDSRKPSVTGQKSFQSSNKVTRNPSIEIKTSGIVQKTQPYFTLDLVPKKENNVGQKTPRKTPLSSSRRTSHRHATEPEEGGYPVKRTCDPHVDCHYYDNTTDNSLGRGRSLSSGRHQPQSSTRNRSAGETRDSIPSFSARSNAREEVKVMTSFIKEEKEPDVIPIDDLVNQYKQQLHGHHHYNYSQTEFEVKMSCRESQTRGLPTDRGIDEHEGNEPAMMGSVETLNPINRDIRDVFLKRNGAAESKSVSSLHNTDVNNNINYNSLKKTLQSSINQYESTKKKQPSIKTEESPLSIQISDTPKSLKTLSSSKGSSAKLRQQLMGRDAWASPNRSPLSLLSRSSVEDFEGWKKNMNFLKKKSMCSFEDPMVKSPGASMNLSLENKQEKKEYVPKGKWAHDRAKSGSNQVIYEVEEEKGAVEKQDTEMLGSEHLRKASSTQFRASQLSDLVSEVSEVPEERPSKYDGGMETDEIFKLRQVLTSEGDLEPIDNSMSYDIRMRYSDAFSGKGYRKYGE